MNKATVTAFEARVAEKVAERKAKMAEASMNLLDNDAFMETQARIANLSNEISKLDIIIHQLNTNITPFIAKDGSKYSVRVFPVTQFGMGLDKLIGIITGSASAFTDEMAMQYEAIVGVPFTELQINNQILGTVDYVNKDGIYIEGSRTMHKQEIHDSIDSNEPLAGFKAVRKWETNNIDELYMLLQSITVKLELYEILPSKEKLTELVNKWEQTAIRRAKKQLEEIEKSQQLSTSNEFTLED